MAKEDFLLKQINQLGFVLKKMIEMLVGSKSNEDLDETRTAVEAKLIVELGFDLQTIKMIPSENLMEFLLQNPSFNPENVELFADLLDSLAKRNSEDSVDFYKKALTLYQYINVKTATFSVERNAKMERIKSCLP